MEFYECRDPIYFLFLEASAENGFRGLEESIKWPIFLNDFENYLKRYIKKNKYNENGVTLSEEAAENRIKERRFILVVKIRIGTNEYFFQRFNARSFNGIVAEDAQVDDGISCLKNMIIDTFKIYHI